MNASSIAVVAVVVAAAALAVWRNVRKGAPCECGRSGKGCSCGCARCG